jgi:hypothetical protein
VWWRGLHNTSRFVAFDHGFNFKGLVVRKENGDWGFCEMVLCGWGGERSQEGNAARKYSSTKYPKEVHTHDNKGRGHHVETVVYLALRSTALAWGHWPCGLRLSSNLALTVAQTNNNICKVMAMLVLATRQSFYAAVVFS